MQIKCDLKYIQELCRLYANTMSFCLKDLSIYEFFKICKGSWNQFPVHSKLQLYFQVIVFKFIYSA